MLTSDATKEALLAKGWVLTDEEAPVVRDKVKASEEWVFRGDGQNNNTTVALRSWRDHSANGDPVKVAEFVALAGIRVPGYVVVSEDVAARGAAFLATVANETTVSFGVPLSPGLRRDVHALLSSLTPPKEDTRG